VSQEQPHEPQPAASTASEEEGNQESVTMNVEGGQHDKDFVVVVNARRKTVETDVLTFDQVVDLAFEDPRRGPNIVFTITYRHAKGPKHEGSLLEGESVEIRDGTVFNVTRTDKS
jgi:hypothetical protein